MESDLAVLVLQTSWVLADAAHDLPAGRLSGRQREELADTLQALGYVLRVSAPAGGAGGALPAGGAVGRRQVRWEPVAVSYARCLARHRHQDPEAGR